MRRRHICDRPEVGIFKRKQESKKTRNRPRMRSRKQENKNSTKKTRKRKKTRTRQRKRPRKKKKSSFFSWSLSWSSSYCFLSFFIVFLFSWFLTFLFPLINSHLWTSTKDGCPLAKSCVYCVRSLHPHPLLQSWSLFWRSFYSSKQLTTMYIVQ